MAASALALPKSSLLTIGYEGATQTSLLDRLQEAGVHTLIDVRALPASRKPGLSKRLLAASAADRGISYLHLQGLGTPKPGRDAARAGDAATLGRIYREHIRTDRAQDALQVALGVTPAHRSCLLCFERDHRLCHRSLVAELIAAETGQQIEHLTVPALAPLR